jgi:hypothetical protein
VSPRLQRDEEEPEGGQWLAGLPSTTPRNYLHAARLSESYLLTTQFRFSLRRQRAKAPCPHSPRLALLHAGGFALRSAALGACRSSAGNYPLRTTQLPLSLRRHRAKSPRPHSRRFALLHAGGFSARFG